MPPTSSSTSSVDSASSLRALTAEYLAAEAKMRLGGGQSAIDRQHEKGRLTARERIALLVDLIERKTGGTPVPPGKAGGTPAPPGFTELGLWAAFNMYKEHGGAPGAGVVTGVGMIHGNPWMIIANDATVKAGAFFPMTCKKIIRAQTMAMMARMPLVYLVDSAGVFLPLQEDVFPDTDDFGRIFRNNAVLSAEGIPQIAAIMGYCVAGGGYLPVLCDTLLMTEGSGLYLAGPALVKAAIGQVVTDEELGGAKMHAGISGTIDFREKDDESCLRRLREVCGKYLPTGLLNTVRDFQRLRADMMTTMFRSPAFGDFVQSPTRALMDKAKSSTSPEAQEEAVNAALKGFSSRLEQAHRERDAIRAEHISPERLRSVFESLAPPSVEASDRRRVPPPAHASDRLFDVFTDKPGAQYDMREVIVNVVDSRGAPDHTQVGRVSEPAVSASKPSTAGPSTAGSENRPTENRPTFTTLEPDFDEYKSEYGPSLVCGYAKIGGQAVGIVANQKKLTKTGSGAVQLPAVIYYEAADKAARFIMDCNQRKIPLVFLHDTTGFMVGKESEQHGIIRAGAKMVNAMSNCVVPKIVVILGGSYGAGNYAMCGRAFDPFVSLAWPSAKCAVMGANQATGVLTTIEEASRKRKGESIDEETHKQIYSAIHASYTEQADIRHGAARGWVDRIIEPHKTRDEIIAALTMTRGWDYSKAFKTGVLQT